MGERRQLTNLTYRLLGSLAEAEDAVQETYARWYAMTAQQQDAIESPGAWLTTVASRICLNLLGSARARRETYVGEWIPEPLPQPAEWISARPGGAAIDPADRVTLDESVSMAFLVMLESMTPSERVAPGRPPSSGPSRQHGKPRTSTPSSACSTPTPRRSPTAVASPLPSCAPSKAASRSPAPGSRSPTGRLAP
jgi:Sigma-70 region 2